MCVAVLEVESHAQADREDIDLEVHHARIAFAHRDLVVHLLGVGVADTHDADVHFDGHVVRGEGDDARRDAQRESIARLVGSLDRRIVREARLRAAHGELRLVEEREPLVAAQRDVLAPDRGHRVVVPQRIAGANR